MSPVALAVARLALALGQRGYPVVAYALEPTQVTVAFTTGITATFPLDLLADHLTVVDAVTRVLERHGIAPTRTEFRRPVEVDKRTLDYWLFLRWHHRRSASNSPSSRNTR